MAGALLGGILGNLIDRVSREPGFPNGHVIDFISLPFNFAIFNLADSAIVLVAAITVIRVMRGERIGK
jgi:signal peptidase II